MDRLIKRFDAVQDGDLALCEQRGVAYQAPIGASRVEYGGDYFAKVQAYDGTPIAKAVNAGRCALLSRHLKPGASVLDWGAGTGAFMRAAAASGFDASGYDVNPLSLLALEREGKVGNDPNMVDALTMWDTIEHMEQPEVVLRSLRKSCHFFASVPIFEDLRRIRESKHYRPGEHLYYWTAAGFVAWLGLYGFRCLEASSHEVDAGRESIGAFAFKRDLWDYFDYIAAYKEIHSTKYYGNSATEEYLDVVAAIVRERKPKTILDFGCGRSDLAPHFWLDGARTYARYDPAIPAFKRMPEGKFDLVFCCDVMEHIPMGDVDRILAEVRQKGDVALFTISTLLARAKLSDGRNAHVTILSKGEWTRWVKDVFGPVRILKGKHDHELVLLAGVA